MLANLGGSPTHSKTAITCDLGQERANVDDLDLKRRPANPEILTGRAGPALSTWPYCSLPTKANDAG